MRRAFTLIELLYPVCRALRQIRVVGFDGETMKLAEWECSGRRLPSRVVTGEDAGMRRFEFSRDVLAEIERDRFKHPDP